MLRGLIIGFSSVIVVVVLVIVSIVAIGAGIRSAGRAIGQGLVEGLSQLGGLDAADVAQVAHARGIPYGDLTMAELRAANNEWYPGSVASTNINTVSVSVSDDHVTTAVALDPISCEYGLAVGDANDPVVRLDGLPGVGVFNASVPGSGPCTAANAPSSGWLRVPRSVLNDAGVAGP